MGLERLYVIESQLPSNLGDYFAVMLLTVIEGKSYADFGRARLVLTPVLFKIK